MDVALSCLFSSLLFLDSHLPIFRKCIYLASHLASHSSIPVLFTSSCASCISSTRRRKTIHEDRHASILAKNRNNNNENNPKNSLAESPSINPHNDPITRRKRIPLFEFAHVFKPLQIQSDTCAFMVLCMEWNLLAVGHCGKRFSKVVMVKMMLLRRKLVGLMDGWRKNVEKDRVAQICLGSGNSKKPDHTARLK